jgi:hypothetical protein
MTGMSSAAATALSVAWGSRAATSARLRRPLPGGGLAPPLMVHHLTRGVLRAHPAVDSTLFARTAPRARAAIARQLVWPIRKVC